MDNHQLTARDLLMDEYFLEWVLKPDQENTLYWEKWIARHPHLKPEVRKAIQLLSSDHPMTVPGPKLERIWKNIASVTVHTKPIPVIPLHKQEKKAAFSTWYKVAALIVGILFAGGLWKLGQYKESRVLVSTGFGEIKKIILPDHSTAVLNGNSSLAYVEDWDDASREVVLKGEAYFSVVHTRDDRPFRVQINDTVNVRVLGTRFTVTNRPRKTRVVLSEGTVKVDEELMRPGDLLELGKESGRWEKHRIADPENYAAFLQNKIIFKDTPLSEIARLLEDNYGYEITFATASIAARSFTGSCPDRRVDLLLKAISRVFNLNITRHGKKIIFQHK